MKPFRISLSMALAITGGASLAVAQHGHGMGHMEGLHGEEAHTQGMKTAGHATSATHTPATLLANNPALAARLQPLLPAGTNLQTGATGFKNLGQFVAAVHVSHNLGISFDKLKADMAGPNHDSLGRAIEDLEPNLSHATVKADVKAAEHQAKQDLDATVKTR